MIEKQLNFYDTDASVLARYFYGQIFPLAAVL